MSNRFDQTPIVISAMEGMFPDAPDLDAYWQLIRSAKVAKLIDLQSRWDVERARYIADKPGVPDRTYIDQAHCLPLDAGCDDNQIPDRQVRIGRSVLQKMLRALPGAKPTRLGFVLATEWAGSSYFDQDAHSALRSNHDIELPPSPAQGFSPDAQVAAIAEGLTGPHLAVDTACASSMYGLDLAQRLILSGQADAVAVMGLTAWLPLFLFTGFSQLMALSPERRLLPYAANASGIMIGEACGVLLIEPLEKALAAGRTVLAVIRRQGLSSDGADRSVFAPGADGQRLMYARTYRDFTPDSLDYLEGHGTATKLGDETELGIMKEFFGPHYSPQNALPIGSVKGLIGHTLAAAGIASIIKVLLMLKARELPPHNAVEPNAQLNGSALTLLQDVRDWTAPKDRPRRAGVASFGFGGANSHVVLEEYRAEAWADSRQSAGWRPLAVMDLECAFGWAIGNADVSAHLNDNSRFSSHLPEPFAIDAIGLRMGPNFLKRLDPYHLLLTDLTHRLADRQPSLNNAENTAVVVGSNLGGNLPLRLMRRTIWLTRHKPTARNAKLQADRLGPKPSLEAIASSLPNMCSGYPAFHFNLRGFHETISGNPGMFWNCLAMSPSWLGEACDALLIGAGRVNKSRDDDGAEGAALFLLQDAEHAKQPIAIIHAVVNAADAVDFDAACALNKLNPEQFDWRGICELSSQHKGGSAQDSFGYLAEATGSETFVAALMLAKRWAAIEVRSEGQLRFTVLIEKLAEPQKRKPKVLLPLEVSRHEEGTSIAQPTAARNVPIAVPTSAPIEMPRGDTAATRLWLQSTTGALHDFFAAQRSALRLISGMTSHSPAAILEIPTQASKSAESLLNRTPQHSAITSPTEKPDGTCIAQLRVDESHPYFFDHALDHVPGILMLEGIVQLAEWSAFRSIPVQGEPYLNAIKLNFRRFCEKNAPVDIVMQRTDVQHHIGEIRQQDQVACTFSLGIGFANQPVPIRAEEPAEKKPEAKFLHKHRSENVLVTSLTDAGNGYLACKTFAPPADHILSEGSKQYYSMLYLLEVTRQYVMLIAHQVWNVPLGLPMNLLSIQLNLDHPAPRGVPITISYQPKPLEEHQESAIVLVEAQLCSGETPIGKAVIFAQALTAEAYKKQRAGKLERTV
jgi:3-oxoacyl-(acyl-carrier-protein) synthase